MVKRSGKILAILCCAAALSACGGGGSSTEPVLAAALPDENGIGFAQTELSVAEHQRTLSVSVFRAGDATGDASVAYSVTGITASADDDYRPASGTLSWLDGETGYKAFTLTVYSDLDSEAPETIELALLQTVGTGLLASSARSTVSLMNSACASVIVGQSAGNVHLAEPCYQLTGDLDLGQGDQLTGVPGATLVADSGTSIVIHEGAMVALEGTADRPVMLRGATTEAGSWNGLELRDSNSIGNSLDHVIIRDATTGFVMNSRSDLSQFSHNQLTGNTYAARLPATRASRIETTSSFIGNARDYVVLSTANLNDQHTFPAIDVPYLTAGTLVVNGELDILAGTEIHFAQGDFLFVATTGTLRATGTVSEPVVFTGEQQTPGFWDGIRFSLVVNGSSRLEHTEISFAGGDPGRPGNIVVDGGAPDLVISNSRISNSLGHGIWVSANQSLIDTNGTVFVDNAGEDVHYVD